MTQRDELTEAERYSLWGEHVRLLFSAPVRREELCSTLYDRDVSNIVYYNNNNGDGTTRDSSEAQCADNASSRTSSSTSFYDEAYYPYCFYRRMLQHTACTPHAAHTSTQEEGNPSDQDEQRAIERMAAKLRRHAAATAKARTARQDLAAGTDSFTLAFCDPKVEAVQAALHEEMTTLLLDIRRHNRLVAEATSRLHFSRLVLLREQTRDDNA